MMNREDTSKQSSLPRRLSMTGTVAEEKVADEDFDFVAAKKLSVPPPPPPPNAPPEPGALRLKVSHKDHGRVVISLSNAERTLVQVQIDETVLRYKGVYKSKASSGKDTKERPRKKLTVSKKVSPTLSRPRVPTSLEPRALPEEQSSKRAAKSPVKLEKEHDKNTSQSFPRTVSHPSDFDNFTKISSIQSIASVGSDDDSTRSPKELCKIPFSTPKRQNLTTVRSGSEPSLGMEELKSPGLVRRRQSLVEASQKGNKAPLADYFGTETKQEISMEDTSVYTSTPVHQRRLQQRQRRVEKLQRSDHSAESFRTTRSARSRDPFDVSPVEDTRPRSRTPQKKNKVATAARATLLEETKRNNKKTTTATTSKATNKHKRTKESSSSRKEPHKEPDDSETASSTHRRIRTKLEEVRKVELTNRADELYPRKDKRSSSKSTRRKSLLNTTDNNVVVEDFADKSLLSEKRFVAASNNDMSTANKLVSKLFGKVLKRTKSVRKL